MQVTVKKATALGMYVLLAFSLAGCGTIFGGSAQEINLSSSPSEATVEFDEVNRTVTTPTQVELDRKHNYELTFSKEGYTTESTVVESDLRAGILVLDILFTGVLGVAIDAGTGAWNSLSPENVSVTLEQKATATAGPDRIRVELGTTETDDGEGPALRVRSQEPVEVEIRRVD